MSVPRESAFALPPSIQYIPAYEPLPAEPATTATLPEGLRPPAPPGVEFRAPEEELLARPSEQVLMELEEVRSSALAFLQVIREQVTDSRLMAYERGELDAGALIYEVAVDPTAPSAVELVPFLEDMAQQTEERQSHLATILESLQQKLPEDLHGLCQKALAGEKFSVSTRFSLGVLSVESGTVARFVDWLSEWEKQSLPLVLQAVPETAGLPQSAPCAVTGETVSVQAKQLYTHLLGKVPVPLRDQAEKFLRSLLAHVYPVPEEEPTETVIAGWLSQPDEGEPQARIRSLATEFVGGDYTIADINSRKLFSVGPEQLKKFLPALDLRHMDLAHQGTQAAFQYFQTPNLFSQSSSLIDTLRGKLETLLPAQEALAKFHEVLGDSPWLATVVAGANESYQQYVEMNTDRLRADAYRCASADRFLNNLQKRHQLRLVRSLITGVV